LTDRPHPLLTRRALLVLPLLGTTTATASVAPALATSPPHEYYTFFEGVRLIWVSPVVLLWQSGGWRRPFRGPPGPGSGPPAEAGGLLAPGFDETARRRARALAARRLRCVSRTTACVDRPPHVVQDDEIVPNRPPDEIRDDVHVRIWLYVRDVTENFPAPAPRGLRTVVLADTTTLVRGFHFPYTPRTELDMAVETVARATAEERMLERLDGIVTRVFARDFG
jgi:hypothetical protein